MEFTSPTGDVTLDQFPGTAEDALADAAGLEAAADVDLSDYGTGTWSAWDAGRRSTCSRSTSRAAPWCSRVPARRALGRSPSPLLPAEDAGDQEG